MWPSTLSLLFFGMLVYLHLPHFSDETNIVNIVFGMFVVCALQEHLNLHFAISTKKYSLGSCGMCVYSSPSQTYVFVSKISI